MGLSLKFQFVDNLGDILIPCWFNLKSNTAILYLNDKIDTILFCYAFNFCLTYNNTPPNPSRI